MENFNSIDNKALQAFNRFMYATNLNNDFGRAYMNDYINQFTDEDKKRMHTAGFMIQNFGYKKVRELITEGMYFEEYPTVEEVIKYAY